jgi:ABC-2 type transport system permease protein
LSARLEDTRYARYDGIRRAPWFAVISLARWSAFGALGARKSWRAKFLPVTLTLIALLPAFAVLAIRAIIGQDFADRFPELIPYRQYLTEIGLDVTIFAAILCPELLCPDRRDNVLSLYLSTAVGRLTYVVGKVIAAVVPLLGLTFVPVMLLFIGNTFFAESATSYLADHWLDSLRITASGLLLAFYVSLVGLAVASFTSRRAFALGGYAALMLIPSFVGQSLVEGAGLDKHVQLIELGRLPIAAARALYPGGTDPDPELAVAGVWWWAACGVVMTISVTCLWWRYRRADA